MKFIIAFFLFSLTFSASAETSSISGTAEVEAVVVLTDLDDRGGRSNKRHKNKKRRVNKKRKRKCSQFGRKIYAG